MSAAPSTLTGRVARLSRVVRTALAKSPQDRYPSAAAMRDDLRRVVRLPDDSRGASRPVSVKRIHGRDPDDPLRWWLDSDNAREGLTSFDVGSIADEDVLAVALVRIAPRPGRLRERHAP